MARVTETMRLSMLARLSAEPWAMHPTRLNHMIATLAGDLPEWSAAKGEPFRKVSGNVAVVPLHGVIDQRADLFMKMFGGVSLEDFGRLFDSLVADSSIGAIVLEFDSPGGSTWGLLEAADKIYNARGSKPIIAVSNTWAASAAYWLAAQADEIVVTPSGEVGSIGVWIGHMDMSAALEQAGRKVTLVSAGKFKVEGNPWEPLGDEAKAEMQRGVDQAYSKFVAAVARGRRRAENTVIDKFGEGRMIEAERAVSLGMADRVATLDQVIGELSGRTRPRGRRASIERRKLELKKKSVA